MGKLTKAQRHGLEWMRDNGPAYLFPKSGPSFTILKRLISAGLIAETRKVAGARPLLMWSEYGITEAGRLALSNHRGTIT